MTPEDLLIYLQIASALASDIALAWTAYQEQQATGRDPTPAEIAANQRLTAVKRALAAAS